MHRSSIMRLNRRELLTGVSAVVAVAVLAPGQLPASDRIVIRNGWILKESDLS